MKLQEIKIKQMSEGGIVVAKDYGNGGAKSFVLMGGYPEFLEVLKKGKDNHYYELFEKDAPWNFVMDLDIMHGDEFFDNPEDLITDLIEMFWTNIDVYAESECTEEAVIVLESPSTELKKSFHIIFRIKNTFFANHSSVKHFSKVFGDYIDQAIYSSNRCFRTIYSSKKTKPGKCLTLNKKLSSFPEGYAFELNSFGSFCDIASDSLIIKSKQVVKPKELNNIPIFEFDLTQLLKGLASIRYTERNLWLNIGFIVKGYSEDAFTSYYEFSNQWEGCKKNDVLTTWNSIKPTLDKHESINELIRLYNIDNPDNHFETPEEDDEYNIEYSASLIDKPKELVKYMNKFLVRYDNPVSYGYRRFSKDSFQILANVTVDIGVTQMKIWNNSFGKNKKKGLEFNVVGNTPDYDNLYIRPEMTPGPVPTPLLNYLQEVICCGDADLYSWMIQYIHTMIKKGRTEHAVVLMGKKGAGKSSLIDIISKLIGDEYFFPVNDINKLNDPFNGEQESTILYGIEEVATNAGEFHKVQEKLKSDITEKFKRIRKMQTNPYKIECYNNYILCTNGLFPVPITEDNRRYVVIEVSNSKIGQADYFIDLKEWVDANSKYIRHYFYNMEYIQPLSKSRPTTKKELELREFNKSPEMRFLEDEVVTMPILFNDYYSVYTEYCKDNGEKAQKAKFLSHFLNANGYKTFKQGKQNKTYVDVADI